MIRVCALLVFAAVAAGPTAHAQASDSLAVAAAEAAYQDGRLDKAARLAADGLRRAPDSVGLRTLQLRLMRQGVGFSVLEGVPSMRRRRRAREARRLLALDPRNALAHDELGTQAVDDIAFELDLVRATGPRYTLAEAMTTEEGAWVQAGVSLRELQQRFSGGRFDLDALEAWLPAVAGSDNAERVLARALRHLPIAIDEMPPGEAPVADLARVYALTDRWDALRELAARDVAPPADALFWRALSLYALGDAEAADTGFRAALAGATPDRAAPYHDTRPLLTEAERAERAADPVAFDRGYWLAQDPRLLTARNERRLEHWARVAEAELRYAEDGGARGPRGSVWVRYGRPERRALIPDVAYAGDARASVYEVWVYDGFRLVFHDDIRRNVFDLYSPPASAFEDFRTLRHAEGDDAIAVDRRLRREAASQTSLELPRFDFPAVASVLRNADGSAEIVAAYGVPLAGPPDGPFVPLPLTVGTFLLGASEAPLVERRRRLDGLPAGAVVAFPQALVWSSAETVQAGPGRYTVAVEAAMDGGRIGSARLAVTVPPASDGLALSDLVLASRVEEGAGGPVSRHGLRIAPVPLASFDRTQPFTVYAELYGLTRRPDGRTDYTFETALVSADERSALGRAWDTLLQRDRGGRVATSSEASGRAETEAEYVIVDASAVPPGDYTLLVRVRDRVAGTEAVAERALTLE